MGAYRLGKLFFSLTVLLAFFQDEFLAVSLLDVGFTVCFSHGVVVNLLDWDGDAFVVQR